MKILYITAQTPYGQGETFILEELLEVKNQQVNLLVIPRNPTKEIFHPQAEEILKNVIRLPLINFEMFISFIIMLFTKPIIWRILRKIVRNSRTLKICLKNLAVLPKGIYCAKIIQQQDITHIHSHWGSTTATMAYIISELTNIPWSFTLHRWDIAENNMLEEKVKSSMFVRCISEHGKNELLNIIGENYNEKIMVVYMGVTVPPDFQKPLKNFLTLATPANFLEVKGHKYLIEACSILIKKDIRNFQCVFFGDGPLKTQLHNLIKEKNLSDYIKIHRFIPHKELIEKYKNNEIDLVILPSITTKDGEHEGIPVSLMEAMAYGIAVISTNTGGIPELLSDGDGIIVEEKSPEQLAEAIKKIIEDECFRREVSEKCYLRVQTKFDIKKNVKFFLSIARSYQ